MTLGESGCIRRGRCCPYVTGAVRVCRDDCIRGTTMVFESYDAESFIHIPGTVVGNVVISGAFGDGHGIDAVEIELF